MPDSQIFEDLPTCAECVAAGYGWSVSKQRCGGYRNKVRQKTASPGAARNCTALAIVETDAAPCS